jgi:hypothetical protein
MLWCLSRTGLLYIMSCNFLYIMLEPSLLHCTGKEHFSECLSQRCGRETILFRRFQSLIVTFVVCLTSTFSRTVLVRDLFQMEYQDKGYLLCIWKLAKSSCLFTATWEPFYFAMFFFGCVLKL